MKVSRSKKVRIAHLLGERLGLKALPARTGVAFNPQFTSVVRGIVVEGTPYKDSYYIRNLYGLFFVRRTFIVLNDSERINNVASAAKGKRFSGDADTVASAVVESVTAYRTLADLDAHAAAQSVIAELGSRDYSAGYGSENLFNLACLLHVSGRRDEASPLFLKCEPAVSRIAGSAFARPSDLDFANQMEQVIEVFRRRPDDLHQFLMSLTRTNASDLGFVSELSL